MFKKLKGYRTQIFGVLLAILGVVQQYTPEVVPPEHQGTVLMIAGILVVILREFTTTAPRKNE